MKLRIIVWTIVGIVVIAGVLFLVLTGKGTKGGKISLDDLKRQAERSQASVNKLTGQLMQAKATPLPAEKNRLLEEAEEKLNQARSLLESVKNSSNLRQAESELREAHRLIRQCRRLLYQATKPTPTK